MEIKNKREFPLVSVCIQTYQHAGFIKECLDGVLMQKTNFRFEIVLGEDESSDGTREICKKYKKKYPDKIRLFLRSRKDVIYINGQATGRHNLIENLKASKGKYIALCEGDDYWTDPLKLQKQVDFLERNTNYSMCFHSVSLLKKEIPLYEFPSMSAPEKYTTKDLFAPWFIPTASMVFRNQLVVPSWFEEIESGDIALHFLISNIGDIYFMKERMGIYRKHDEGISNSHKGYRKAIAMSRLYHYVDSMYKGKYRELVNKAIKYEFDYHVVQPQIHSNRSIWAKLKIKFMNFSLNKKERKNN